MSELQPDQKVIGLPNFVAVGRSRGATQLSDFAGGRRIDNELPGIGPPFGHDREASPQINLAPPLPKRRKRRKVSSPGEPSRSASHPSIGWIARRLPTFRPPILIGRRRARDPALETKLQAKFPGIVDERGTGFVFEIARHAVGPVIVRGGSDSDSSRDQSGGGKSSVGLRSKKPSGRSMNPTDATGITGQSSSRGYESGRTCTRPPDRGH